MNSPQTGSKKAPAPVFLAATLVIFFLSLSAADSVGFTPCYLSGDCAAPETPSSVQLSDLPVLGEEPTAVTALPERIIISAIDLDLPVQNPATTNIDALDALLQKGPARYVDSAKLGEKGNVLLFAHSSHLPVVHNQMFKAFNRIPELKAGDSITVQGGGKSFVYSVTSVRKADATEATIDLSPTLGHKLTLVTCDTLTGKSARYILEADLVATF